MTTDEAVSFHLETLHSLIKFFFLQLTFSKCFLLQQHFLKYSGNIRHISEGDVGGRGK